MLARLGRRTVIAGAVAIAVLLAAGATVLILGPSGVRDLVVEPSTPAPTAPRPSPTTVPPALDDPGGSAKPATATAVRDRLRGLLDNRALGKRFGAYVVDPATGHVLLQRRADQPATPASTAKLSTATAALRALGPQHRLKTTVERSGHTIILVGGGDVTLRGPGKHPDEPTYPEFASLAALAKQTSANLDRSAKVRVRIDDSLYTGPRTAPGWKPNYVPEGDVAPVSALTIDEGRKDPREGARYSDPALSAGQAFAQLLEKRGVTVRGQVSRAETPDAAKKVAKVSSPTIAQLVEYMLTHSDNDIAETLVRQVALAKGKPASFHGASAAVDAVLAQMGLAKGITLYDGSGLSTKDKVTPKALTGLLRAAASGKHPKLRAVLSGLPVGGFSGTLATRFGEQGAGAGAGAVRAKTGTLDGVSSLAGYVRGTDGRVLVFAFVANGVPSGATWRSRIVLDKLAARLAGCGCN
ncbi:MAG: D-alanyl-D-alanine carboxypeptidase/D-alanyl-D-alanine endopeptidase [Streptosporangiales bacterium]